MAGARAAGTQNPMPLVDTRFDVGINGGLATVSTLRTFRNGESESIEVTITFPIPVHAVLFSLEARVDGRILKACARAKVQARATYEDAIERGKGTVLHEELLRGVHMLSVGNIAPGAEIQVTVVWALVLTNINGAAHLRIPLTVGDVYGCSGLPDSDELLHGGVLQSGRLNVECLDGTVTHPRAKLAPEGTDIPLNVPIDLVVTGWSPRHLHGRAADGRNVVVRIEPGDSSDTSLNVALAIDHSGSMGEICSSAHASLTKHQAAVAALKSISLSLKKSDAVDIWEFDDALKHVGLVREQGGTFVRRVLQQGSRLSNVIKHLSTPAGGTEIGGALAGIAGTSTAQDILLITDGKSHALDVQALSGTGRRFSVVLIGEDSLEANVGHLAAISGGEIFIASEGNLTRALQAAFTALRSPPQKKHEPDGSPDRIAVSRSGMKVTVQWHLEMKPSNDTPAARATSAIAASLALQFLDTEAATALAEAEGLVTHLTSLVLVDEAAEIQSGIPANRKVFLPSPATGALPVRALYHSEVRTLHPHLNLASPARVNDLVSARTQFTEPAFSRRSSDIPDIKILIDELDNLGEIDEKRFSRPEAPLRRLLDQMERVSRTLSKQADLRESIAQFRTQVTELTRHLRERLEYLRSPLEEAAGLSAGENRENYFNEIMELNLNIAEALSRLSQVEGEAAKLQKKIEFIIRERLPILFSELAALIDWDAAPGKLQVGDLSNLDNGIAQGINALAHGPAFTMLSERIQVEPVMLAIGLIAQRESTGSRTAARIAKSVIGDRTVDDLMTHLAFA